MVWKGVVVARSRPRVDDAVLIDLAGAASRIAVGSPAWYAWLEDATTFAFRSAEGSFIARKERRGRTGWYWKAYRKQDGRLHRAYLGKSADLTLDRLTTIADDLAGRATEPPAIESPSVVGLTPAVAAGAPPRLPGAALPTGTLTFCFTDIEGSTQLWEQHPSAMRAVLAHHDAIMREAIQTHRGIVFKMVGDSVHAVFERAENALSAALDAQRALAAEPWGETEPLRVRMALHTGAAELRDDDYFGPPLNRVARILALGHAGQILLSRATHDLVADDLPEQTSLHDLGEHHLRDISRPERIFQLMNPDLPTDFPPLHPIDPGPVPAPTEPFQLLATKLYVPLPRPHFVRRERLVARLGSGLTGKLTLISAPAGFGKTTLVSEWRTTPAGSAMRIAWVSLDADDNDATHFWSYVIAALETVYPATGATAPPLSPPSVAAIALWWITWWRLTNWRTPAPPRIRPRAGRR